MKSRAFIQVVTLLDFVWFLGTDITFLVCFPSIHFKLTVESSNVSNSCCFSGFYLLRQFSWCFLKGITNVKIKRKGSFLQSPSLCLACVIPLKIKTGASFYHQGKRGQIQPEITSDQRLSELGFLEFSAIQHYTCLFCSAEQS